MNLTAVCEREVHRARDLAPQLAFTLQTPPSADVEVRGDQDAVREALGNLLDNARRHATATVAVSLALREDVAEVRVRDDGGGLSPDAVDEAFGRFVSLDGHGGSGLGLPIARGVARAHGGDLVFVDGAFVMTLAASATGPAEEDSGVHDV